MDKWMQALAPEELQARVNNVRRDRPYSGRILRRIRFEDLRSIPAAAEQLAVECGELESVLDGKASTTLSPSVRRHARHGADDIRCL